MLQTHNPRLIQTVRSARMKNFFSNKKVKGFALLFLFLGLQIWMIGASVENSSIATRPNRLSDEALGPQDNRTLLISDFLYVFNTNRAVINRFGSIPFSTSGPIVGGFAFAPGSTTVTVLNAGTYKINFYVSGPMGGIFGLLVNGGAAAGTIYGSGGTETTGQAILVLPANTNISLGNLVNNRVILQGSTRAPIIINASLTIERYL